MLTRNALRYRIQALILGLCLAAMVPPMPTGANGLPVTIILSYLDGVSNFGPRNATGISEFVARESELRLQATGLPHLTGEEYRVWITNTGTGQKMPLASFNTTDDGRVNLDTVLDMTIPDGGWNLMFLTVETERSSASEPNARHSIAGRWPDPNTSSSGRPAELPLTGGPEPPASFSPVGLAALIVLGLALALGIGVAVGRRTAGRGSR